MQRNLLTFFLVSIFLVAMLATAPTYAQDKTVKGAQKYYQPDHIVIVFEENHSYKQIIGSKSGKKKAPYMNYLAKNGANMTNFHGVWHPSQPNYLAFFYGTRHGIKGDAKPKDIPWDIPNLAAQLRNNGYTFMSYNDGLPRIGSQVNTFASPHGYARKHNPWTNSQSNIPSKNLLSPLVNQPFENFPCKDYSKLPTVTVVIPNLAHDMHDGTIQQADKWLKENLSSYAKWAKKHNSLLVITWDEDGNTKENHIPTIFYGAGVLPGDYDTKYDLHSLRRTIQAMYGLKPITTYQSEKHVSSFTEKQWKQNRKPITKPFKYKLGKPSKQY